MFKIGVILFVLFGGPFADQCRTIEETELVMAFLVHRHGDRTPQKQEVFLSDNPEKLANLSEPYGYGKLTDLGYARSFILGKYIRRRYGDYLSSSYNSSEIFVQCTSSNRSQVTANIAITAAYSNKQFWSEDMVVKPVDCHVVSPIMDPNLSILNCQPYSSYFLKALKSNTKGMIEYNEVLEILSEEHDFNVTHTPLMLYAISDVFDSQKSVGLPLSHRNQLLAPSIKEGARAALRYLFGNQTYIPMQAGVLLNEFFKAADLIISGANIPKIRILSGHDFNVYSFSVATRAIPRLGVPGYCSVYSLELRKCKNSGQYVVVPIYVRSPEDTEAYLEIENCGTICDYHKFRELTSDNVLNDRQYREKCNVDNSTQLRRSLISDSFL